MGAASEKQFLQFSKSMSHKNKLNPGRKPKPLRTVDIDLQSALGDAPHIYLSYGLDHAVAYLRQLPKKHKGLRLPPLAERVALLGKVAKRTDPKAALELAEKAMALADDCVEAWLLSGSLYDGFGRKSEATAAMLRVIGAQHAKPMQRLTAASWLARLGQHEIALREAAAAFVALGQPLTSIPALLHIAQRTAEWALLDELTTRLREGYASGRGSEIIEEPRDHLLWCSDLATNIEVTRRWSARMMPRGFQAAPPVPEAPQGRRLRVGYLSSDFRNHPTARLINGLFRQHDKNKFELFMYCSGWDDGSELRKQVCAHFEHIHLVSTLTELAAAELMRSHKLDILVEINGPTRANRMGILAHRPAPVQIDYLAFPGSVGGRVVDYIIGDDYTIPDRMESLYPEKIIRIPHTYQVNDYAARPPLEKRSRTELEMPDGDVLILGMFNNINKVHGEVWDAWMRILSAVPNALLWTLNHGHAALKNIALRAMAHGIDPNRIIVGPGVTQDEHLLRMQACDLMLDPWPYGGHTTTSDALFAGVPVITLEGSNFAGRVSGGLLTAAGLASLVRPDVESYVQEAIRLLQNPEDLAKIKQYMRDNIMDSPVFDTTNRARAIEAAYLAAFERAEKSLPPEHIRIDPSRMSTTD